MESERAYRAKHIGWHQRSLHEELKCVCFSSLLCAQNADVKACKVIEPAL
jgi:hypothetical protein